MVLLNLFTDMPYKFIVSTKFSIRL